MTSLSPMTDTHISSNRQSKTAWYMTTGSVTGHCEFSQLYRSCTADAVQFHPSSRLYPSSETAITDVRFLRLGPCDCFQFSTERSREHELRKNASQSSRTDTAEDYFGKLHHIAELSHELLHLHLSRHSVKVSSLTDHPSNMISSFASSRFAPPTLRITACD